MDDQSEEKEFAPTPQKLKEARKKGEIAKSGDLNTAASYLGFLVCIFFVLEPAVNSLGDTFVTTIELSSQTKSATSLAILGFLIWNVAIILTPIFIVPAVFVIASILAQRSVTFAPSKIQPKLNRISPVTGVKNKFGRAGLFEFFKSFAKLLLFMGTLAFFLFVNFDRIAIASQLSPGAALLNMTDLLQLFIFMILVLAALIGSVDFVFQKADHQRKNRMSHKDLQDEAKNAEGNPYMKQRRRQKAMALASGQLAAVPQASVVMVNPTHYAVALQWDPLAASAPIVLAKGADEIALRIRTIATENTIPLYENPPETRALYAVAQIGDPVPPDQYEAVAAAIRFAESMSRKKGALV